MLLSIVHRAIAGVLALTVLYVLISSLLIFNIREASMTLWLSVVPPGALVGLVLALIVYLQADKLEQYWEEWKSPL